MTTITAKDPLPGSISGSIVETGGHSGNTTVSGELIIQDSITGNITVLGGGKLVIKGSLTGDVINQGSVELASGGTLDGNFDNSGQYQLDGTHNGETMNLLSGSMTKITGQGAIDIFSQKGAQMSVAPSAKLSRSSGNGGRTMSNDGALNISGSSVEHSLTNTGSVVVTGSVIFK